MWIEISLISVFGTSNTVIPFAGVWIEISESCDSFSVGIVTPFAGVWIEICLFALLLYAGKWSLPLRECGLKYINNFTGAHIAGHSLCGSVD